MLRARRPVSVLLVVLCLATVASAQWRRRRRQRPVQEPAVHNIPYDGQFTFARLKFTTGQGGFYYFGLPAWAHGYPRADDNLSRILDEVTAIAPHVDASNVLALDDPALDEFPVAFMTEAGYWTMTDEEAAAFRAYLLKGGFVIFDDFRDDFGNAGWMNFDRQMQRVLPGVRYFDLSPSDPIFHAFFDIDSFDIVPQVLRPRRARLPGGLRGQRPVEAHDGGHQLQHRHLELLGVLSAGLPPGRGVQRGVQAGRELRRVRHDALTRTPDRLRSASSGESAVAFSHQVTVDHP